MPVAPVVAFAGKVNPLGVPKLVAHERQVPFAAQGTRDQANHLRAPNRSQNTGVEAHYVMSSAEQGTQ